MGHETDFTIADFVADVRAPTPTAAAQLVSADRADLCEQLRQSYLRLTRTVARGLENRMQRLDYLSKCLVHPGERVRGQFQHLAHLANRLCSGWRRSAEGQVWEVRALARALASARPDLERLTRERADLARRLRDAARERLDAATARLGSIEAHLKHLNPELVLDRGYSIVQNASGAIVRDAAQIAAGDEFKLTFARGSAQAQVQSTKR